MEAVMQKISETGVWIDGVSGAVVLEPPERGVQLVAPGGVVDDLAARAIRRAEAAVEAAAHPDDETPVEAAAHPDDETPVEAKPAAKRKAKGKPPVETADAPDAEESRG